MPRSVILYLIGAFCIAAALISLGDYLSFHGVDLAIMGLIIYSSAYIIYNVDAFATVFVAYLLVIDKLHAVYEKLSSHKS